jgi:hypothetical protein
MQAVREAMNLLQKAASIPNGVKHITEWLGSGGTVVSQADAQERANICLKCPKNVSGLAVTKAVALAIKAHLETKNQLRLRVQGEKSLHSCEACGCVLRLLVWEPQDRVQSQLTDGEVEQLPDNCWKLKE